MTLLLELIVICSIWTLGIKIVTEPNMLLEKLGAYGERKAYEGHKIFDALLVCLYCTPSIHSLVAYGFAVGMGLITHFEWKLVLMYPLVVMGTSIINGIVWGLHQILGSLKDSNDAITRSLYHEHQEEENITN